jgi:AraC family transcriptional regulator
MRDRTRGFYETVVTNAVDDIASNLDTALDLGALAARAATSSFHFHRIFRGMVDETPLALSRRLRLERAAYWLANTDKSVAAIAFDTGFDTHEAFTRAFRAAYAVTPSSFRRRGTQRIELAGRCGVHYRTNGATPFTTVDRGVQGMNVEIVNQAERRVATVTHVGPYNQISEAFERLGALAGAAGLFDRPEPPEMVAIYHDDPEVTTADALRSDAGVVIPDGQAKPDGLGEIRLPAGRYARTTHIGPYELLGDAWSRFLGGWLPSSGHRIGPGGTFEIYRNYPTTTPPEALTTDLYIAVE